MPITDIFVTGIGTWLPPSVSIDTAVQQGRYPAEEVEIHGWQAAAVAGSVAAPDMALSAAQQAVTRSGRAAQVDLLLYTNSWHQGPDGWQPQYYLQRHLVGGAALAVQIQHGCNGVFSALQLAVRYLRAEPQRQDALIVAADNFGTPLIRRWRAGPGLIAGDAAGALMLSKQAGFARLRAARTLTLAQAEEQHRAGEPLFPPGATMGRRVDLAGRAEAAQQARAGVAASLEGTDDPARSAPPPIQHRLRECVDQTLAEAGIALADITRVAVTHAGRKESEDWLMGALGLPLARSTWDFARTVGQLGAGDQILSLEHLLTTGQVGAGDHVLLVGVTQGVTLSCAVLQLVHPPPWLA